MEWIIESGRFIKSQKWMYEPKVESYHGKKSNISPTNDLHQKLGLIVKRGLCAAVLSHILVCYVNTDTGQKLVRMVFICFIFFVWAFTFHSRTFYSSIMTFSKYRGVLKYSKAQQQTNKQKNRVKQKKKSAPTWRIPLPIRSHLTISKMYWVPGSLRVCY